MKPKEKQKQKLKINIKKRKRKHKVIGDNFTDICTNLCTTFFGTTLSSF